MFSAWLLLVAPAFLLEQYVSSLCAVKTEKLVAYHTLFSQLGELFLAGEFSLGVEQYWLEGWDDPGKMKLFSFVFVCVASLRFFV